MDGSLASPSPASNAAAYGRFRSRGAMKTERAPTPRVDALSLAETCSPSPGYSPLSLPRSESLFSPFSLFAFLFLGGT
jgi:hypothetical protein